MLFIKGYWLDSLTREGKTMTDYVVTWTIDITADSPEDAAREARACQQPGTSALTFDALDEETGISHMVNLQDIDEAPHAE